MVTDFVINLLLAGLGALTEYLSAHVLTCLVPAFFIAGAISTFLSKEAVLRFLGPRAPKPTAYGVASVSGSVLAVCSCTVLPLFGGIYKHGAGIGPATAFLYAGPAVNVLAVVYSARLLGLKLGVARAVAAVAFSVVIGLIIATVFARAERRRLAEVADTGAFDLGSAEVSRRTIIKNVMLFVGLVGVLVFGAPGLWIPAGAALAFTLATLVFLYSWAEVREWLRATWSFVWLILPWLLGGVFFAGIMKYLVPDEWVAGLVGGNGLWSNLAASLFGTFMYFATLTEVPIVRAFADMGMADGPILTLLLAGPALSLPSVLAIRSIMGNARTVAYVLLVIVFSTAAGLIFGNFLT
ncbi:MAG: permease [Candidatus Coatesbacteria bacterium]|nr:MAG: permease [Candidatus Coatesbacteria bacterium]